METLWNLNRKEKRKIVKKLKRKAIRKEVAKKERAEEETRLNPATQHVLQLQEQAEVEALEEARKQFEEQERIWLENHTKGSQGGEA